MKKKRTYSRKQKALRWMLMLVGMIVLLNVTGIYHILPEQTNKASLQKEGLASTEVIHREWARHEPIEDWLLMVSQNRDAVVLTAAEFHPLTGWYDRSPVHEILFDDPETYARSWIVHKRDVEKEAVVLFGFVPSGEEPPTFKIGMYDYRVPFGEGEREDLSEYTVLGDYYFDSEPITITPTPTIPVKGGKCYLEQVSLVHKTMDIDQWDSVVLCDVTGEWEKCKYWTSTSTG